LYLEPPEAGDKRRSAYLRTRLRR